MNSWVETLLRWRKVNAKTYMSQYVENKLHCVLSLTMPFRAHLWRGEKHGKKIRKNVSQMNTKRRLLCNTAIRHHTAFPVKNRYQLCIPQGQYKIGPPKFHSEWLRHAHKFTLLWVVLGSWWLPEKGRTTFFSGIAIGELPILKLAFP